MLRRSYIRQFGHIWALSWHAISEWCDRKPNPAPFSLVMNDYKKGNNLSVVFPPKFSPCANRSLMSHCIAGEGGGEAEEEGRVEEEEARGADQAHGGGGGQERERTQPK